MLSPVRLLATRSSKLLFAVALFGNSLAAVHGQEKLSHSILMIEELSDKPTETIQSTSANVTTDKPQSPMTWSGAAPGRLASSSKGKKAPLADDPTAELVRDRFPSGKPHVERKVTLDAEGNYVNNGEYRELSEKGELLVTGHYDHGLRTGLWAKFLSGTESPLLKTYPFNKLRAPFSSTVDFDADTMNGVWVISDRDKHIACEIQLQHGQRQGTTTFYHPSGQVYLQSNYENGVLEGQSIEKNQDGKVVREEFYSSGRKQVVDTEYFNNKSVKGVTRYLSAALQVAQPDNWATTSLATYAAANEKELHGEFVTYYDNGQMATKGNYLQGQLHGSYESWFRTGELSASGAYDHGQQEGDWVWRHANGMKRAVATYDKGQVQGDTRAWDEKGKSISAKNLAK